MATVTLSGIHKRYPNEAHAVRGVDMEIGDGEFIVFVGPSGCGKSTLLRMVAGLETITEGEITIDGRRINEVSPADRDVAMVFQNYALYPHMSVSGNMSYGLKNRGLGKSEIAARVREVAGMLRIEEYLERRPHELSGGQRQRVAMGRAIVRSPKVFLFDEPLSNLDAKLRVQMRIEIKRLQRSMNVTSIYVTHDQTEAMTLADRLAVINDGLIEQIGSPIELYNNPQTLFVASFIGSPQINLLPTRIEAGGLRIGGATLPGFEGLPADAPLVLGLRPDHMIIADNGQLEISVDLVEQLGADNLIYGSVVDSGGAEVELCVRTDQSDNPAPDDRLRLGFDRAHAMIFREDSGDRLI